MLLVFHDSAKIGERVTTRYTILHCAILHFTLCDTKLRGDLTRSQTGNFRRPVLPSNIDLFETFDHGETQEGEEREERKTSTKAGTEGKTCDLYNYYTHVSMDACSHVATDFVSDVLLSLNYWHLFVTIRRMFDLTLICVFFILPVQPQEEENR